MSFQVERTVRATPEAVFTAVTDFVGHGRYVPLTWIDTDPGTPRAGWRFVARTGVGPIAVPDDMVLTVWEPPHRFRLVKLGPVLRGWADVTVEADAVGARVRWVEEIQPPVRLGPLQALSDRVGPLMVDRILDGLLASVGARA